jgi:hypothetical protein
MQVAENRRSDRGSPQNTTEEPVVATDATRRNESLRSVLRKSGF